MIKWLLRYIVLLQKRHLETVFSSVFDGALGSRINRLLARWQSIRLIFEAAVVEALAILVIERLSNSESVSRARTGRSWQVGQVQVWRIQGLLSALRMG